MRNILKSRLISASLMFLLIDVIGGLLIVAPLLVFLRIQFEYSGSALKLWPIVSPEIFSDLLINHGQALLMFLIAAAVIWVAYFPLRVFFAAGIYGMIIPQGNGGGTQIDSVRKFLTASASSWIGFIKIDIFGILVYVVALFLGLMFGSLLGQLISFLKPLTIVIFLLLGSTYIQILKIEVIARDDTSLVKSLRSTRDRIGVSFLRLILGNAAVVLAGFIAVLISWSLLTRVRGHDWTMVNAFLSILLQQAMIFFICLAQVLRINFNSSVMGKGE